MSDITLSSAVRSNLLSLQNTADMMATTQNRLATGKKVNSALDNPTNFFTASSLNARAGDMNQLLDGMANGIQTLQAADNGLTAITKTLESMQSTLRQARQDKSFQTESFKMNLGDDPTGNEQLTISGGALSGTAQIDLSQEIVADTAATETIEDFFDGFDPDFTGTGATVGAGAEIDMSEFDGSDVEFTMNYGGESFTITVDGAALDGADEAGVAAAVQDAIDDTIGAGRIEVTLGGDSNDELQFTETVATGEALEITSASAGLGLAGNEEGSAGTAAELSFDLTLDDGSSTPIVISGTDVLEAGFDPDNLTAANFASLINNAVGSDIAAADGDDLVFTSATEGDTSRILIENFAAGSTGIGTIAVDETGESEVGTGDFEARSVDALVTEINRDFAGELRASNDNGRLRIENLSTTDLTVEGLTDGELTGGIGEAEIDGNSVRAGLADQYNELRDQLDKLADDASFNGVNLLRGDNLQITFNETGTSEINIRTDDETGINSTVLDIRTSLSKEQLDNDGDIDGFLNEIKGAINTVRSQASAFGSNLSVVENRQQFSKNMINTLETGAANLTLADSNEEAANLLALQTRQQLSSTALSMASQQDQSVLRLF